MAALVLVAAVVALTAELLYPFRFELPVRRLEPVARAGSSVTFSGASILGSGGPQRWVSDAIDTGRLSIELTLRTRDTTQLGPQRILAVSRDVHNADLVIAQEWDDLVVRVRRPGSDRGGKPAFRVPDLLADRRPHDVEITITTGRVAIVADGSTVVDEAIASPFETWDPRYRVALGNEPGGHRAWSGTLQRAEVQTSAGAVDLLDPSVLESDRGLVWVERVRDLAGNTSGDPAAIVILRVLVFVPIGAALFWLDRRWSRALAVVGALAAATFVVRLFVETRHPSMVDAALGALGGTIGVAVAAAAVAWRSEAPTWSEH